VFDPISKIDTLKGIAASPIEQVIVKNFFNSVVQILKVDRSNTGQLLGVTDKNFSQLVSVNQK